jgi:hypothetical protein
MRIEENLWRGQQISVNGWEQNKGSRLGLDVGVEGELRFPFLAFV